jgi:hypothetical protein
MAEAANYLNYYVPSPEEAFLKNSSARIAVAQQRAAIAKQQADQQRAQEQQEALQSIRTDRSPENLARVTLLFPDLGKQIADSESILNADQIKSDNSFRAEVISLFKSNPDAARARLQEQADGYANTIGKEEQAAAAASLLKAFDENPDAVILPMTIHLAQSDKELYETLFVAGDPTVLQKDYNFIRKTFGDEAAAEFAQFGRSGITSIPLGDKTTYVGPPSMAPGASVWKQQPSMEGGQQPTPETPQGAAGILASAARSKTITQAEANVVRQSLGKNGQTAFQKWITENRIKIIVRTGTAPDGRRVVEFEDGTIEYGAN